MTIKVKMNIRFIIAQMALQVFPLKKGRSFLSNLIVGEHNWPKTTDISFKFGRFINASLDKWPEGFRELWCRGIMEDAETRLWQRILCPGDIVFDIGANWGYWTLVAANTVKESGTVVAFEPLPMTASALEQNIHASNAKNVIIRPHAVGDKDSLLTIYSFHNDPCHTRTSANTQIGLQVQNTIQVPVKTLSAVTQELKIQPDFIKIDAEGSEFPILKGYKEVLTSAKAPFISVEYNEATAKAMGYHPQEILDWLSDLGYQIFLPRNGKLERFDKPKDTTDWSPMIWAFRPDIHASRIKRVLQSR